MIISDLNYLESVTEEAVIGGGKFFNFYKNIDQNINTNLNFVSNSNVVDTFYKTADINVKSDVKGNSSSFAFDNEAVGPNSNTQGTFNQLVVAGQGSSQNGLFVAAAN